MPSIEEQIKHEIEWRTDEISIIKTTPFLFPFSDKQREVLKKHAIPTLYSLWEGFVVACSSMYSRELNSLRLSKNQIHINILAHSIDMKYGLKNARTDFLKQISFIQNICEYIENEIELPIIVPTESNINFKTINNILHRFNLSQLPEDPYKKRLDRLLFFRNKLAHGENSIPVTQEILDEMSFTVISAMHAVTESVLDGYIRQTYLHT